METRPEAPDQRLLDEAMSSLAAHIGRESRDLSWQVGPRIERKRSTLIAMTVATAGGEPVATAYYKEGYFPDDVNASRHRDRARLALERGLSLSQRYAEMVEDDDVSISVLLAADPPGLRSVTLGLEGRPMGTALRLISTPARRSEAAATCYRVGRAVRKLEQIEAEGISGVELVASSERKLGAAESFLDADEVETLQRKLDDLYSTASSQGTVYSHGDLSPGNIIMMGDRTGLIDFLWMPQLRGYDLSRFVHRLRHTTLSYRPWADALADAAIEGYGDPQVTTTPGWRFSEMMHLLNTLRRLDRRGQMRRGTARRALAELRFRMAG